MNQNRRRTMRAGISTAAAAALLLGTGGAASAGGGGAQVTKASGPTYLYGTVNPLAGVALEIHAVQTPSGKTIVSLHATGFAPNLAGRTFGAHVHVNACGATGAAAGPHHQNSLPTTDLEAREIWLDLTVGADGTAQARATRDWVFTSSAQSVVVHESPTDPTTGAAGPRLACTDAPFRL